MSTQLIERDLAIERRTLMLRAEVSQTELAQEWGTSQSFVSQLLDGKVRSDKHERLFVQRFRVARYKYFPPREAKE